MQKITYAAHLCIVVLLLHGCVCVLVPMQPRPDHNKSPSIVFCKTSSRLKPPAQPNHVWGLWLRAHSSPCCVEGHVGPGPRSWAIITADHTRIAAHMQAIKYLTLDFHPQIFLCLVCSQTWNQFSRETRSMFVKLGRRITRGASPSSNGGRFGFCIADINIVISHCDVTAAPCFVDDRTFILCVD